MKKRIEKRFFSAAEASAFSGLAAGTLANLRSQKRGCPYYRRGRKILYDVNEFENWVRENHILTSD